MKPLKGLILLGFLLSSKFGFGQKLSTDTIGSKQKFDHVLVRMAFSDSLCSSFIICIKDEVKAHKHIQHAEHVLVLDGFAEMMLGDSVFSIRKNDLVFIPKNTWHAVKVKGKVPLKVLSIQSPFFDGKDRVMREN